MEGAVYILCALTALTCAVLLLRGYRRSRTRLLLWCGIFFVAMTVENALVFVDLVVVPEMNLINIRRTIALIGVLILLNGLIHDVK
ncbi:MAG TPA: DUF5985 family protein [Planctomycetaceae bacterium]|nr:DUF5985 family protein [Planctomycetaceae bacterium]